MKLLAVEAAQWGTYYVSRYQQIQDYGYDVHLLTGEGTPGSWPEERHRSLGSKQLSDLVDAAREWHETERFDGVFTIAEMAVVPTAHIAEELGFQGIGVEAARTSRNKLLMHRAHERAGVPHARFRYVETIDDALAAAHHFGYPVVLKPTLGAGSGFVFRVDGPLELRLRFDQATRGIDHMPYRALEADGVDLGPHGLLVESFLDGHEHLIEATAWDDDVYLGSIVDRVTLEGDTFDDDVHHTPTELEGDELRAVHDVVTAATRSQGLRRSAMHAEVRFHRGMPHILEIAARPGGGGLDYMSRVSAGHCPLKTVAQVACGARPDVRHYRPTGVHTAAMCLICPGGTVKDVNVPAAVADADGLLFLKITVRPGDVVKRPPDGNTVFGFLGATGASFQDAMATATELAKRIEVRLETPVGDVLEHPHVAVPLDADAPALTRE